MSFTSRAGAGGADEERETLPLGCDGGGHGRLDGREPLDLDGNRHAGSHGQSTHSLMPFGSGADAGRVPAWTAFSYAARSLPSVP